MAATGGIHRQINTRSPFYIQLATNEPKASLELKIYSGNKVTDKPATPTYTLLKEGVGGQVTFEVSELIRDFFNHTESAFNGALWVESKLNDFVASPTFNIYIATEGYTLYNEGLQHNGQTFESDIILLPEDTRATATTYPTGVGVVYTPADHVYRLTAATGEGAIFQYIMQPTDATSWTKETFISSGSTGAPSPILATDSSTGIITTSSLSASVERVRINANGVIHDIVVDRFDCNKWNNDDSLALNYHIGNSRPVTLMYINKYGARNTLHFTLKRIEDISVSDSNFTRNTADMSNLNYGGGLHASRRKITGSKQSFTINSDYVPEYYVKQFEELIMSEYVWAKNRSVSSNFQPVNLTTKKLTKKTALNDGLIQYTFNYETASEYINNVR